MASALTKSKLIARIAKQNEQQLSPRDVELAVKHLIEVMADTLSEGGRIETCAADAAWCRIEYGPRGEVGWVDMRNMGGMAT